MRTRHETPTAFNCKRSPIQRKNNDRVDRIHNPSMTEHERALEALAMMKELERNRKKKLVSVRVDDKTVISSDKKRIKELVKEYNKK